MTNDTQNSQRGRPRLLPGLERRIGSRLEHYVMEHMSKGRSSAQVAADLGISRRTLQRRLRERGYRIECDCRLVAIGEQGRGGGPAG